MSKDKNDKIIFLIEKICEDNKADNVKRYDVRKKSSITDCHIICSGNSDPHIRAIREKVIDGLNKEGVKVYRIDASANSRWIVIDLSSIIFHIFHPQLREFYALDELLSEDKSNEDFTWTCPDNKILYNDIENRQGNKRDGSQSFFNN